MRIRAVAAASLLLVAGAVTPAGAAPARRLVLSGTGIRYVDVAFAKETVLDFDNVVNPSALTASYRGGFAGFAVQSGDARHRVLGGAVLVRGRTTRVGYEQPVSWNEGSESVGSLTLRAGRYRLVLVADGPAEVRVRATRGLARDVRLVARGGVSGVTARRHALADLVPAGEVAAGNTRVPVTLTAKGMVVGSFFSVPGDDAVTRVALCFEPDPPDAVESLPCREEVFVHPGRSISVSLTRVHRGESALTPPGRYVLDHTETIAGPTVGAGNAFVLAFTDAD